MGEVFLKLFFFWSFGMKKLHFHKKEYPCIFSIIHIQILTKNKTPLSHLRGAYFEKFRELSILNVTNFF